MLSPINLQPQFQQSRLRWSGALPRGLYRLDALFDASRFDWERLYLPMRDFGNDGQRTGPWDFDFNGARPLLPAWWFSLNGERLGLAICPRPSPAQLQNRRLDLRLCFEVEADGATVIELQPYNDFDLDALQFHLSPEQDDVPRTVALRREPNFARAQEENGVLEVWQCKLETSHAHYEPLIQNALDFAGANPVSEVLPLLAWAARTRGHSAAREKLLAALRKLIALEHWGNPLPDGYGHDGDMGAAAIIEPLSFVLQWYRKELEEANLFEPLRAKLLLQMRRFYRLILLTNGYWGGSLLQDHGHRSVSRFGVAAINLLGENEEAVKWLEFAHQRMARVLAALPPDGAIPFSSYHKVHLYMDDMTTWRDALRHATGEDVFGNELFPKVVAFVANRLYEPTHEVLCASPRGDRKDFYAGWGFFNAIAEQHGNSQAARLTEILRERYRKKSLSLRPAATLLTALDHDALIETQPLQPENFDVHAPSGHAFYRLPEREIAVAMRCPPPGGSIQAAQHTSNPCDLALDCPLAGHFTVSIGEQTLLLTAEGGYRMRSSLGCVLLVDGKGGYSDEDYAMGIPGLPFRGETIVTTRFDEKTKAAYVRMNLAPAYRREAQLLRYEREFFLSPGGLLCRDTVVRAMQHEYSWHFPTYARRKIEPLGNAAFRISDGAAALSLRGSCAEGELQTSIAPTEVVWAYQNENNDEEFLHIEYSIGGRAMITAEFAVSW
jgi:hypothetical protein